MVAAGIIQRHRNSNTETVAVTTCWVKRSDARIVLFRVYKKTTTFRIVATTMSAALALYIAYMHAHLWKRHVMWTGVPCLTEIGIIFGDGQRGRVGPPLLLSQTMRLAEALYTGDVHVEQFWSSSVRLKAPCVFPTSTVKISESQDTRWISNIYIAPNHAWLPYDHKDNYPKVFCTSDARSPRWIPKDTEAHIDFDDDVVI